MRTVDVYFVETTDSSSIEKSFLGDSLVEKILKQTNPAQIPLEELKENIKTVLDEVSEIFSMGNDAAQYYVDEIEFGIGIGVEGKVSLLSVIGGSAAANSTMVIKMKRRKDNE